MLVQKVKTFSSTFSICFPQVHPTVNILTSVNILIEDSVLLYYMIYNIDDVHCWGKQLIFCLPGSLHVFLLYHCLTDLIFLFIISICMRNIKFDIFAHCTLSTMIAITFNMSAILLWCNFLLNLMIYSFMSLFKLLQFLCIFWLVCQMGKQIQKKKTITRKSFIASCKKKPLKWSTLSGGQAANVWGSA